MAFGNKSRPTRKYEYAVTEFVPRPYTEGVVVAPEDKLPRVRFPGHDQVIDQMYKATKMRNKIVEAEIYRREESRRIVMESSPDLLDMKTRLDQLEVEIKERQTELKRRNAAARKKKSDPVLAASIRGLVAQKKQVNTQYKTVRKEAYKSSGIADQLAANEKIANDAKKSIRNEAVADGLYWPTANFVLERVHTDGMPPKTHDFDGTGTIALQIQRKGDKKSKKEPVFLANGKPRINKRNGKQVMRHEDDIPFRVAQAYQKNNLVRIIRHINEDGSTHPTRVKIMFRIGSNRRKPVWAEIPARMHRPLPEDGDIKWVYLSRSKIGTHAEWRVFFDIAKDRWDTREDRSETGVVAIATGWRFIDNTLRVASWYGSDGQSGDIIIPEERFLKWKRCDQLQSKRSNLFNDIIAALRQWKDNTTLPEEFSKQLSHIHVWKSARKIVKLLRWWREHRHEGDDEIFDFVQGHLVPFTNERSNRCLNEIIEVISEWRNISTVTDEFAARIEHIHTWCSPRRIVRLICWWRNHRQAGDAEVFSFVENNIVNALGERSDQRDRYSGGIRQDKHLYDWQEAMRTNCIRWRVWFYRQIAIEFSRRYAKVITADIDWCELGKTTPPESKEDDVSKTNKGIAAVASLAKTMSVYMNHQAVSPVGIAVTCRTCGGRCPHPGAGRYISCEACGYDDVDKSENAARNLYDWSTVEAPVVVVS